MLLTIEKVVILKTVSIFSKIPENDLIELSSVIEESHVKSGDRIITKGEMGSSMYIIVTGKVRVHDGETEITTLQERDFFGELAALDPHPRSASVTAMEDTTLFCLKERDLYELITEYVEVGRGILQILCQRLRSVKY